MSETTHKPEIEQRWEVQPGDRFLPYAATVWMNEHDYGWHYRVLDHPATTLPRAIKRGLAMNGSDDFNIAVIRGGRMVAVLWMEDDLDEDQDVIDRIADALGVTS